jgi:hypothetical protein
MLKVRFDLFLDRPHIMKRLGVYQRKVLGATGAYGRRVMKSLIRPPLKSKRARTVVVSGRQVIVPIQGKVVDAQTMRPVSRDMADAARQLMRAKLTSQGAGKPPRRGPTDKLRRHIYFSLDPTTESVVIGPAPFANQPYMPGRASVPELLDKGGYQRIVEQMVKYEPHPYTPQTMEVAKRKFRQLIEKTPLT